MSSYFEHIDEITSHEIFVGLLAHGLFSSVVPPAFSADEFTQYVIDNNPGYDNNGHDFVRYESIRNINVPRLVGIPLPFPYSKLCAKIKSNWSEIVDHFEKYTKDNPHKVSKIHIRKMKDKDHLFEMNYKGEEDDTTDDADLLIGARFLVSADISNCFPSIYTHSIPWALVGKPTAKTANRNTWFNKLDKSIRNIRNNETNGILIGPHAFNLIAEIVLVVVDRALTLKGYKFTRHIDDYTCFCKSHEEAEAFLLELSKQLKVFELSLNHKKTVVAKLPLALSKHWVRKLSHYRFKRHKEDEVYVINKNEVEEYLDSAIELMASEKDNTAILNWAIKKISKENMSSETLKLFIDKIHHLVLIYPYLVRILQVSVFDAYGVTPAEIKKISLNLIKEGLRTDQYEMVSFGLFFAIQNRFKIALSDYLKEILDSNDCVLMTLAYLHQKRAGRSLSRFETKAKELRDSEIERFWLFVYEALPASELTGDYLHLKNHNVSFINSDYR